MNDQESGQTMRARGWKFFARRGARGTIVNWHVVDARGTSQGSAGQCVEQGALADACRRGLRPRRRSGRPADGKNMKEHHPAVCVLCVSRIFANCRAAWRFDRFGRPLLAEWRWRVRRRINGLRENP
jgi:hypothetical protein